MKTPVRVAAKFFASPDPKAPVDLDPYIGVFHRFIQGKTVPGLLLDVADYIHVPDGPGVVLIGHDVDYGIDSTGGETGLLTTGKRHGDADLEGVVRTTLRNALAALRAIEAEDSVSLVFDTSRVDIHLIDRLRTPNTEETYTAAVAALAPVAEKLFAGGYDASRIHDDDPRKSLAVRLAAREPADAATLQERLGGA
ncbi:MAG: hypothetical protein ACQGVK_13970 [Myxococcota bacterium]